MNNKQLRLFNRLVLAQAYIFSKQCEQDNADMPPIAYRIKTAAFNSFHINRFDDEERACIKNIAELPGMEELKKMQTSAIINILELIRIWVEEIPREDRPNINISDKKLLLGKNHYVLHMMKLRKNKPDVHSEMKELVQLSTESVEKWYNMAYIYIKENYHAE